MGSMRIPMDSSERTFLEHAHVGKTELTLPTVYQRVHHPSNRVANLNASFWVAPRMETRRAMRSRRTTAGFKVLHAVMASAVAGSHPNPPLYPEIISLCVRACYKLYESGVPLAESAQLTSLVRSTQDVARGTVHGSRML